MLISWMSNIPPITFTTRALNIHLGLAFIAVMSVKRLQKLLVWRPSILAELLHQIVYEAHTNQTQSSRHKYTLLIIATFASSQKKLTANQHSLAEVWHFQEAHFMWHSIPWNVFSIFFRQHFIYFSIQAALVELLPWC